MVETVIIGLNGAPCGTVSVSVAIELPFTIISNSVLLKPPAGAVGLTAKVA
ncbi:TPA: hypothetical protein QCU53_004728 [Bacillus thuringiensis]|nr:hypothetical protein [Bacillus thuringiensis]